MKEITWVLPYLSVILTQDFCEGHSCPQMPLLVIRENSKTCRWQHLHEGGAIHSFIHFIWKQVLKSKKGILRKEVTMHLQTIHILEHGFPHCKSNICVFLVLSTVPEKNSWIIWNKSTYTDIHVYNIVLDLLPLLTRKLIILCVFLILAKKVTCSGHSRIWFFVFEERLPICLNFVISQDDNIAFNWGRK